MDKRYQVFVSSTYADLQEERQHVLQALMEMDCIPAGMELFPAADEEQWKFIQTVIDDCDYYLLIIGGRYGSITSEGISYTEKEFDYAVKKGLKIVALVHGDPGSLPFDKSEQDPDLREKLSNFKEKVMTDRLVKFWGEAKELPGLVALSLTKTIKMYPAVGWVRADKIASNELFDELHDLRKKYDVLLNENTTLKEINEKNIPSIIEESDDLADLNSSFNINYTFRINSQLRPSSKSVSLTWDKMFAFIAPYLTETPNSHFVKGKIESLIRIEEEIQNYYSVDIDDQDFQTISLQLKAYGLVNIERLKTIQGGYAQFWTLTSKGEKLMIQLRTIKKEISES